LSHLKERTEKNCLNCNADLYGRYCHICGQENLEPKESVWHLITHFFNDITHFDGKFFSSVKLLLLKPGFLSKAYMIGKRASYLNPIRMYVFTSAIFFLIFFALRAGEDDFKFTDTSKNKIERTETVQDWEKQRADLIKKLDLKKDADEKEDIQDSLNDLTGLITIVKKSYGDTTTKKFNARQKTLLLLNVNIDSLKKQGVPADVAAKIGNTLLSDSDNDTKNMVWDDYKTVGAYDSAQLRLPDDKRNGWFMRHTHEKIIGINEAMRKDKKEFFKHMGENLLHSFPKILFFSLPFFALILKFVYVRRKQFYYTDHGIFSIHLYCAVFIIMLFLLLIDRFFDLFPGQWAGIVKSVIGTAVWFYIIYYVYRAMRVFYAQGLFKTIIKYGIVSVLALLINLVIFIIFAIISAVSV
jgi:Protein of unknown function (DUF3667)